jgi:hypothetical protein
MKHPSGDLAREEAIRVKAYEIWLSRGCPHGTEKQDWIEAERYFESLAPESSTAKDERPSRTEPETPTSEPAARLMAQDMGSHEEGEPTNRPSAAPKMSSPKRRRSAGLAAPQPAPESNTPGSGRREKPAPGPRTASTKPPTEAAPDSRPTVASAHPRRKGPEPRTSSRRR